MTEEDLTSEERWPTMHRLARDLEAAGAPPEMVAKASAGYYDDFHPNGSEINMTDLYRDLHNAGLNDLAEMVKQGEWDATKEESDAWAESPEGQETFAEFAKGASSPKRTVDKIAADHAIKRNNPLINGSGERLPLKHPGMMLAAVDVIADCGATDLEVSCISTVIGERWSAQATAANGEVVETSGFKLPEYAVEALARKMVNGGLCDNCGKPIQLGGDRHNRHNVCRWKRIGPKWVAGCQ